MANKVKKGDKVIVLSGKDKGKVGLVERVLVKTRELIISKVNVVKKHVKVSKKYPSGGTVEISKPLPFAKVQVICPSCDKPTRIGIKLTGKNKERFCKKCGKIITAKNKEK